MALQHPCKNPYMAGSFIEPLKLKKDSKIKDFIDNVYGKSGYNARKLAEACDTYSRMIDGKATVGLTLAGAMTPIGFSGPLISLMEAGFIDFIISTGANLYHDLHRAFDFPMVQGDSCVDDCDLNKKGVARIYDVFIQDEETLMNTDKIIAKTVEHMKFREDISTATFHNELGKYVLKNAPHPEKSLVAMAAKFNVPIFTSSPGDSSIGMNLIVPYIAGHRIPIQPSLDIIESTAIVREAIKNGAVIVGGGSPKNFYMQTQPTLWQILYDNRGGHDYFVQLTTDSPQWGGLSGATPQEAKSWGKVKDPKKDTVVVYSCASITFPLVAQYVLEANKPRPRKELFAKLPAMKKRLCERVLSNKELYDALKANSSAEYFNRVYKKSFKLK